MTGGMAGKCWGWDTNPGKPKAADPFRVWWAAPLWDGPCPWGLAMIVVVVSKKEAPGQGMGHKGGDNAT